MTQIKQLNRLGLFDAKAPRYTSYPTAPHFNTGVGPDDFANWIQAIPQGDRISLYVHIPFCRRLCWFCACRTQGVQTDDPILNYIERLEKELQLLAQHLPQGVTLSQLHWGGGTPTILSPNAITRLAQTIAQVAPFSPDYSFSVEIDPNEIDAARVSALVAAGMNRASLGIQDFDPEIQQAIGRPQGFEDTKRAFDMLRDHGITSINADLVYGLPHQTPQKLTNTVQKLMAMLPDRIALYGYAHVPWMARRQNLIDSDSLPSAQQRLKLFETARDLLKWDNYQDIGIDHFALPHDSMSTAANNRTLKRNFQGYTVDPADVLIGLGASSISKFPQGFAQNAGATSHYAQAIEAGQFATSRGHAMTSDDKMRAKIIESIMCHFNVQTAEILDNFDISRAQIYALFGQINQHFEFMLDVTDQGLFIPEWARPLTRMIAQKFDAYDPNAAKHSSAI